MKKFLIRTICILIVIIATSTALQKESRVESASQLGEGQVNQNDLQEELRRIEEQLNVINNQINDINGAISAEEGKQVDLSNDINYLTQKISQTELEIKQRELDIEKKQTEVKILETDLKDLEDQIATIEIDINKLQTTASEIVNSIYIETKTASVIDMLFTSQKGTDFISSIEYQTALRESDQATLEDFLQQKKELEEKRNEIDEKTTEQKRLAFAIELQQDDLERSKEELTQQQVDKTSVLNSSYSTVYNYEGQLGALTEEQQRTNAERNLVLQQIQQGLGVIDGQFVAKGQWIAKEGNTGCGTGNHGHIVVLKDGVVQNGCNIFPSTPSGCGVGNPQLEWPMRSDAQWFVTGFYTAGHEAVDVSYASSVGSGRYFVAPFDGYLHRVQSACSTSWCNEATLGLPGVTCNTPNANGAILCQNKDCSAGWQVGFWHVE